MGRVDGFLAMREGRFQAGWIRVRSMLDPHTRQSPLQLFHTSIRDPSVVECRVKSFFSPFSWTSPASVT